MPLHVTIVAKNHETLAELQGYFRDAGVDSKGIPVLADLIVVSAISTVVLFPDDYPVEEVGAAVARLSSRPHLLMIIVTRNPKRYEAGARSGADGAFAVVLPKPAWGWTILDAIRAHVDASS